MIKRVSKYILLGIAWGFSCLVLMLLGLFYSAGVEAMIPFLDRFPLETLGAAGIGIAYTVPALLYGSAKVRAPFAVMVHLGIGTAVFVPVATALGWIPKAPDLLALLGEISLCVGIFFLIWLVFFFWNRNDAKRINARLKELNRVEKRQ